MVRGTSPACRGRAAADGVPARRGTPGTPGIPAPPAPPARRPGTTRQGSGQGSGQPRRPRQGAAPRPLAKRPFDGTLVRSYNSSIEHRHAGSIPRRPDIPGDTSNRCLVYGAPKR
jgi:hypothetical protein